ncbi:glycosyltransferase family 2 protein [Haladaptatus halobius]|uniref:glycosyltransferase family 2 protein n=1 Tax=Haladaptatus halobius TaxID=2884875 RepID=UPI001D0B050B|nr:glycosyltransferase family A protein [Haladaptatus halobius]
MTTPTGDEEPTVSVVLPTYDRGDVVGDAIESVLDQTYRNLELLVVDGGSTDETLAVVESAADPRLSYLRRDEPEGVSAARNIGIRAAEGELVAFIDSDDRWRREKLRKQVDAPRTESDCGVVYCGMEKSHGEPMTRDGRSGDVLEALRHLSIPTYTSLLLVTREALDGCGGFDERLPCFEDWELCLRLARRYSFAYVDEPLVVKGDGGGGVSADPENVAAAYRRIRREYDLPDETRAQFLADAGTTYCEDGRLREGRPYLRRSLELDFRPNAAAALAFSLPGSHVLFDALIERLYAVEHASRRLRW